MSIVHQLLNFFDAPAASSFDLAPSKAVDYFRAKGLRQTFSYRDMVGAEHASSFTIAKMADLDLLADVQASLDDAIAKGLSYETWANSITPLLQQKGWWGRKAVTDPLTGETVVAQLGSPGRLKTIFRTNVQGAYAAGNWQQIQEQKDVAEYLLYDAVDDHRTRPEHKAWDGTVLAVDHPWWKTHFPPNGWNCRCGVIQVAEDELEELGLEANKRAPRGGTTEWTNPRTQKVEKVEKGLDPGWNSNPGETHLAKVEELAREKVKALPPKSRAPAAQGLKVAQAQAKTAAEKVISPPIKPEPVKPAPPAARQTPAKAPPARAAAQQRPPAVTGKAQVRNAERAIAKAQSANTPFLAKAIREAKATPAGAEMDAVELLATATAAADLAMQAAALLWWRSYEARSPIEMAMPLPDSVGRIVFDTKAEYDAAIEAMHARGITVWSDGRPLEEVFDWVGSGRR